MACVKDDLVQPLCLTLVYNINSGELISSTVTCNTCNLGAEFNPVTNNLTLRVPFIAEGMLTINDTFQATYVTKNVSLANSVPQQTVVQETVVQEITQQQSESVVEDMQTSKKEKKNKKEKD